MYLLEGNLNGILNAARAGLRMAEKLRLPEILSCFRYDLGYAHYLKNEFTQAEPYLLASLDDRYFSAPNYLANSGFVLALMYLSQDRKTEAIRIMNLLEATFWETNASSALASTLYFRVELAIQQGNLTEAHHLSQSVDFELGLSTWWFFYMPQLTPIKLLLALGTPQSLNEARDQLNALHKSMSEVNRKNALIEVLALQALVYAAQGDQSAADQKLFAALELGFIGGNIRSFVDLGAPMAKLLQQMQAHKTGEDQTAYIEQILGAFPSEQFPQHMPVQVPLDEPLTNRELEVLALLAQRLSNKEIAAELVISPRTVKRHTLNIYKKLAVNSRQQAVEKASELGIFA
jgi:LuxR family maltose regulon positive regulatory protein